MDWTAVTILMVGLTIAGVILNALGRWHGFLFWLVTNAFWAVRNFHSGDYAQGLIFSIFWVSSLLGIMVWRRRQEEIKKTAAIIKSMKKQHALYNLAYLEILNIIEYIKLTPVTQDLRQRIQKLKDSFKVFTLQSYKTFGTFTEQDDVK